MLVIIINEVLLNLFVKNMEIIVVGKILNLIIC